MTSNSTTALLLREAVALHQRGAVAEAAARYAEVLRAEPGNVEAHYYLGLISCQDGRFEEGIELARKSLVGDPCHARAHVLLGRALSALGRNDEALASFDRAIELAPQLAQAHGNRGTVLRELGRSAEAIASYDRALALAPDSAADWFERGIALMALGRPNDAVSSFDRAVAGRSDFADAYLCRAKAFSDLGRANDALESADKALAIEPALADAWLGRGNILFDLKRYEEAIAAFDRALALKPDLAQAWFGRGNVLSKINSREDAFSAYDRAVVLEPNLNYAAGARLLSKLHLCDWTNLDIEVAQLLAAVRAHKLPAVPFVVLTLPSSAAEQLQCAKRYIQEQPVFEPIWRGEIYAHARIRVAYLSADFHEHATANLIAGLFAHHDKSRFEITGISFGPNDGSAVRQRITHAFERFVDVQQETDRDIANLIRGLEVDIAVDLKGFTADNRLNILALRPAPIQVAYLGYPGTTGASYIDYILADSTVIPEDHCAFYSEQVVWLPDSYQINDDRRHIAETTPTRRECGLPESAFVFCCFNGAYKITPEIFDIWARLLRSHERSVLWLLEGSSSATTNLCRELEKRGVSPQRLIFAPRMNVAEHLARHRQADLFLDILPVNAHTTASDALWAGLPVLTCLGETFVGRVAGSLLRAVGLPELVTGSLDDYESLALKLAREPSYLASIKDRLARNRKTLPLFDTARTTRHIEKVYETILEKYQNGEVRARPADAASVKPIRIG